MERGGLAAIHFVHLGEPLRGGSSAPVPAADRSPIRHPRDAAGSRLRHLPWIDCRNGDDDPHSYQRGL